MLPKVASEQLTLWDCRILEKAILTSIPIGNVTLEEENFRFLLFSSVAALLKKVGKGLAGKDFVTIMNQMEISGTVL